MVSTMRTPSADEDVLAAGAPEEDRRAVARALDFARGVYGDKLLGTGEPAYEHAIGLVRNVAQLRLDADSLVAGVLFAAPAYVPDAEEKLREASAEVFARFGDTLRERFEQMAAGFDKPGPAKQ